MAALLDDDIVDAFDPNDPELRPGDIVLTDVKSKYLSKTNITAALLFVFGLLTAFKVLPEGAATPEVVGVVVSSGAALVAFFRTIAKQVLK